MLEFLLFILLQVLNALNKKIICELYDDISSKKKF